MFLRLRVSDGEYIINVSRGIIKNAYEVISFIIVKVRNKTPLVSILKGKKKRMLTLNNICIKDILFV